MNPSLQARIAAIDWASKGVPDVPRWLNDLLSDDKDIVYSAWDNLDVYAVQGGIDWENFGLGYDIAGVLRTDAPDLLVDFLIELLKEAQPPGLSYALGLLASQSSYIGFRFSGGNDPNLKRRALTIYGKIWDAHNSFIPFLMHADREVRNATALLLCYFRDKPDEVIPLILDAIAVEDDIYTLASHLQRFTMIFLKRKRIDSAYEVAYFSLLNDLLVSPLGLAVQTIAAYHLIEQLGAATPENALNKLVEGMIVEFDHNITLGIMAARVDVQSRILMKLPTDIALSLILKVLSQTDIARNALYALVAALLAVCEPSASDVYVYFLQPTPREGKIFYFYSTMGEKRPSKFHLSSLTSRQKHVIQAAVENDLIWTVGTDLFDQFGLPSNRDALRTLVA